jgi:hypothetical protein
MPAVEQQAAGAAPLTVKGNEGVEEEQEGQSQGHQLLNVTLAQGGVGGKCSFL